MMMMLAVMLVRMIRIGTRLFPEQLGRNLGGNQRNLFLATDVHMAERQRELRGKRKQRQPQKTPPMSKLAQAPLLKKSSSGV